MPKRTVIPFGPHHPVLPEPIHLDLVLEDEKVVEAIPNIGFIHRGLELLCEKKPFQDMVLVAERICGICSLVHGIGFCNGVEKIMNLQLRRELSFSGSYGANFPEFTVTFYGLDWLQMQSVLKACSCIHGE